MTLSQLISHARALSEEYGKLFAATKMLAEASPKHAWLLADVSAARATYNNFLLATVGEDGETLSAEFQSMSTPEDFEGLVTGYERDYVRLEKMFVAATDEMAANPGKGCGA